MIDLDVKFDGFDDVEFFLSTLTAKIQKRVIKQSLRRGAVVMQKAAKANAPSDSGTLKRSIKVRTGRSLAVQVYAQQGGAAKDDGWYAHMIERGTVNGIEAEFFMESAAEQSTAAAVNAVASRFEALLMKELAK